MVVASSAARMIRMRVRRWRGKKVRSWLEDVVGIVKRFGARGRLD